MMLFRWFFNVGLAYNLHMGNVVTFAADIEHEFLPESR